MRASVTFPELQSLLLEKSGQHVSFAFVDRKTVRATYPLNLGIIRKDISANLTFVDMDGSNLTVGVDAGLGTDTAIGTMLSLFRNKIPEGMIERLPNRQLLIRLDKIEQLKEVFEAVRVDDLVVHPEGLEVEGALK